MVVFQETRDADNNLELRLFLNGKTYVETHKYSYMIGEYEAVDYIGDDLASQVKNDYKHYPITDDFWGISPYNMRYGMIVEEVTYLHWNHTGSATKRLYDMEQRWLVGEGAKPLSPAVEIPEMQNIRYRLSFHHDGSAEETMFYTPGEVPY